MKIEERIKFIYFLLYLTIFFLLTALVTGLTLKTASAAGSTSERIIAPGSSMYGIGAYGNGIYGIYGHYGPYGQPANISRILIDKFVSTPKTNGKCEDPKVKYFDNFLLSDPRLKANQEVCFKISVKNTTETSISDVKIQDSIPQFLNPIEGPGSFEKTAKMISFDAGKFDVNEEKSFFIKMTVVPADKIPADIGIFCMNNKATASINSASDEDTSQICIEK